MKRITNFLIATLLVITVGSLTVETSMAQEQLASVDPEKSVLFTSNSAMSQVVQNIVKLAKTADSENISVQVDYHATTISYGEKVFSFGNNRPAEGAHYSPCKSCVPTRAPISELKKVEQELLE